MCLKNINTLYKIMLWTSPQAPLAPKNSLPICLFATSPPEKNELWLLPCKRAGKMSKWHLLIYDYTFECSKSDMCARSWCRYPHSSQRISHTNMCERIHVSMCVCTIYSYVHMFIYVMQIYEHETNINIHTYLTSSKSYHLCARIILVCIYTPTAPFIRFTKCQLSVWVPVSLT